MSAAAMPFKSRIERFLVERHGLGFSARGEACILRSFARHLHDIGHCGPLTVEVMTDWARRAIRVAMSGAKTPGKVRPAKTTKPKAAKPKSARRR